MYIDDRGYYIKQKLQMFARSILFYILLCIWTVFLGIINIPYLIIPSNKYLYSSIYLWIKGIFLLLKYICKITHEIQGKENISTKPVLVASKHQSAFETFALFYYLPRSVFIHKKQLFLIPIFGQYLKKINMISIDRRGGTKEIRQMLKKAKEKINSGFSIIIFPEGTRKKPGEVAKYKSGFVSLYRELNCEILPIAVNSGKFWPKHTFVKKEGHIIIKILPIIKSGMGRKEILIKVENSIEEETSKII